MSGRKQSYAGGPTARYLMLGSAVVLMVVGLVMVFSASYVADIVKHGLDVLPRPATGRSTSLMGLAVALVLSRFDYRRLQESSRLVWWACIALLVVTFARGRRAAAARGAGSTSGS